MAHISADRVRETTTTTGTGALALAGIAPTGFRTFSSVCAVADTAYYAIQHQTSGEWEVGLGTYSAANTLTRTTIYASSNSGAAVNFSSGAKDVFITLAASRTLALDPGASALAVEEGGTGATTEAGARTNLGLGTLATKGSVATVDIDDNAVTSAKMSNTGVSAGAYTAANITVDSAGRVTSAASGTAGGTINVQSFDASGMWTKPSGYSANSRVHIQAWGGGASGRKTGSTATQGGGGGGGGYNERWMTLSQMGATETITIGAGGAAVTGTANGNDGGDTTVGSLLIAYGGGGCGDPTGGGGGGQLSRGTLSGEPGKPWSADPPRNGFGGKQGGGGYHHGGAGGDNSIGASNSVWGGAGGGLSPAAGTQPGGISSFAGNGGTGGYTTSGTAGSAPGGGGGATRTGASSGAGGAGRVIITVFPA